MVWQQQKYTYDDEGRVTGRTSYGMGKGSFMSKAVLIGLAYLVIINIGLFSKQAGLLIVIGIGIWLLLR